MKAVAVIPARLASSRLPGKVLQLIAGEPMLAHVYQGVRAATELAEVIVATDSPQILDLCRQRGWHASLTSAACRNGTERVQEVSRSVVADLYINVQGDEVGARPEHIAALIGLMADSTTLVGTLKTPCSPEEVNYPHAVKVVADAAGRALYFSRATIPYDRDRVGARYYKHLGFYAYRKSALDRYVALPESDLERSERLEQLRFLENGIAILVAETPFDTLRVDTDEDLRRAEQLLAKVTASRR
jgi:3-deoxy-manno-octulosonate cytidylyltransferase (CMP-KDO synthetase)